VAVHPDDLKRVTERWRKSQMTGEPLDYEARLRRGSDGVYRWFQTPARPLRDSRGKIVMLVNLRSLANTVGFMDSDALILA
jgi:PAS domain-containing protein